MVHLAPGTLLNGGKYVLVKELNRGGSAVVMEAVQALTGRRVALKASRGGLWRFVGTRQAVCSCVACMVAGCALVPCTHTCIQAGEQSTQVTATRTRPHAPCRWCSLRRSGCRARCARTSGRWQPQLPCPAPESLPPCWTSSQSPACSALW